MGRHCLENRRSITCCPFWNLTYENKGNLPSWAKNTDFIVFSQRKASDLPSFLLVEESGTSSIPRFESWGPTVGLERDLAAFLFCWEFWAECTVKDLDSKSETPFSSMDPVKGSGQYIRAQFRGQSSSLKYTQRKKVKMRPNDASLKVVNRINWQNRTKSRVSEAMGIIWLSPKRHPNWRGGCFVNASPDRLAHSLYLGNFLVVLGTRKRRESISPPSDKLLLSYVEEKIFTLSQGKKSFKSFRE